MCVFDKASPADGSENDICIACGETVSGKDSWEWDKHGDRWNREGKEFEAMCEECFDGLVAPRQGRKRVEERATTVERRALSNEDFVNMYMQHTEDTDDREGTGPKKRSSSW